MASLLRKVIIITGASSGIGAASAIELAKYGPRLVLHGRNEKALSDVKQKCIDVGLRTADVAIVTGDITEENTVKEIVKTARHTFGTIHVIFNNAGYVHQEDGPIHMGGTVKAMDDMYNMYVRSPYLLVQESLAELIKNKGVIINCSSGLSTGVEPNLTAYCTHKAGMDQLTKCMAIALGMKGVRVNTINPGFVKTSILDRKFTEDVGQQMLEMIAKGSPFEQKLATPEEIARVVVFMASDQSAAVHGHNLLCDLAATLTNPIVDFTKF